MAAGVPQKAMIVRYLAAVKTGELDQGLALLDSTIVRAHPHAAGARKKRGRKPLDAAVGA